MKPSRKLPGQDDSPLPAVLKLRLYVAGMSPNSVRALTNLHALCGERLDDDDWQLEVVDVFTDPMRAVEDKILVTPTLLRLTPPVVQIVGDLSQRETVLAALDLAEREG
jgi:circadian clock protein KaiB